MRRVLTLGACVLGLVFGVQSEILYQDQFDNDTLTVNTNGIGGGAVNRSVQGHYWADDGDATFVASGTTYTRRALLYSSRAFRSETGFKLTVYYTTGNVGDTGAHKFSFGLIRSDTDLSTYSEYNPFYDEAAVYSLGVNLTDVDGTGSVQGLNFADGTETTTLDLSGDNVQFVAGSSTPVVVEILPDGSWSYSINGIEEASGTIPGGFDCSKNYRFAAYGQDDNGGGKSIQSVVLEGEQVEKDFYVSTTGDDANPGTLAEPFATIQHAVDQMIAGDSCYIRGGSYHEVISLDGISGTVEQPITLTAYEDEEVILDGRVAIETAWTLEERDSVRLPEGNDTPTNNIPGIGNVYVTTLDSSVGDVTQLFVDDEMMTLARWPNAPAYSDGVFLRGITQTLKSSAVHGEATDMANPFSLADTGVSVAGCVGMFGSVRLITNHVAGTADFSHNNPITLESGQRYYFLEGGLDNAERVLLDSEQEWAYDESSGKLTFWPANGENPNDLRIYGRNLTYALTGNAGTGHIIVDGLDFFAATFDFNYSDDITIRNCNFTYYSISDRAVGGENNSKTADFMGSASDFCENITVYNCTFRYADGTGFTANYIDGLTFENNLIYKTGYYTCNEFDEYGQRRNTHAFHAYHSKDIHYRRNTVDTTGTSQSVTFGRFGTGSPEYPIVSEYNFNTKCCGLMTDVSSMYIPEEDVHESVARFNWFIDNRGRDFRWDGANVDEVTTARGNYYRNVHMSDSDFSKGANRLKGDYHEIYNSIALDDAWYFDISQGKGGNANTVSRNNAADVFTGVIEESVYPDYFEAGGPWEAGEAFDRAQYDWDLAGDDSNNYSPSFVAYTRSISELLRDPDNWDFRPRSDAVELIDQGAAVTCTVDGVSYDVTAGYNGAAPDIGAYEYGDTTYWIGGRQEAQASMPIPKVAGAPVPLDTDLMYLIGLDGVSANIYFGTSSNALSLLTSKTDPENIVTLSDHITLENETTYYWRVDTVRENGTVVSGEIWSFITEIAELQDPEILPMTNRTIQGAYWALDSDSGDLVFYNNGTVYTRRAVAYSTDVYQSDAGFRLTTWYTTGNIGDVAAHKFSFGLISTDTDLSTYIGFNPFNDESSVYSLGANLTAVDGDPSERGLNFTDGTERTTLDQSGDHVEFVEGIPTRVVIEILPDGVWSYSINGITEASGVITGGFDLSKSYRVAVYGQDDNGGGKSIQHMALELLDAERSYEMWAVGYGLSGDDALPDADIENGGVGDGFSNFTEYALGMNPTNIDPDVAMQLGVTVADGTNWFEMIHARRSDYEAEGLHYLLIDLTNLVHSVSSTNAQDQVLVGPTANDYQTVTNRYEIDGPAKFIKLEVHQE